MWGEVVLTIVKSHVQQSVIILALFELAVHTCYTLLLATGWLDCEVLDLLFICLHINCLATKVFVGNYCTWSLKLIVVI